MQSSKAWVQPARVLIVSFGNSHGIAPVQKEQMLISLVGAIPEAFVLRDEVSAASGKQPSPSAVRVLWEEKGIRSSTVAWLLLAQ